MQCYKVRLIQIVVVASSVIHPSPRAESRETHPQTRLLLLILDSLDSSPDTISFIHEKYFQDLKEKSTRLQMISLFYTLVLYNPKSKHLTSRMTIVSSSKELKWTILG